MNRVQLRLLSSLIFLQFWGWALNAQAQVPQFGVDPEIPAQLLSWRVHVQPTPLRAGEHGRIVVEVKIHPGWHIYSLIPGTEEFSPIPTQLSWSMEKFVKVGDFYETNPIRAHDKVIAKTLSFHKTQATFYQNFTVPATLAVDGDKPQSKITARYQICSDKLCLPPREEILAVDIPLTPGEPRSEFSKPNFSVDPLVRVDNKFAQGDSQVIPDDNLELTQIIAQQGFWGFIGLAVLAGLFALLTPCVFPMIPITVGYFSRQLGNSHFSVFKKSSLFAFGIIVTYTVCGMALSVILGATGVINLASNPWMNLGIGLIFGVFAFSLMGYFELNLPLSWVNPLDRLTRRMETSPSPQRIALKQGISILLLGLVFTLTSFTCTIQFIGTLLIAAAQGHWLWPILGMIVFATTFTLPFFVLGFFPHLLHSFKASSGDWLIQCKTVLGLIELGAAIKFISNADLIWQWGFFDRDLVLVAWIVLSVFIAIYLLGWLTLNKYRCEQRSWQGFLLSFITLLLAGELLLGFFSSRLHPWIEAYLPPPLEDTWLQNGSPRTDKTSQSAIQDPALNWLEDLAYAQQIAYEQKKRIFIDFTGYTCVNCRWMEKSIFPQPKIWRILKEEFILVRLYTDGGVAQQANQKLQLERFKTLALPFYVILSPGDQELARHSGLEADVAKFMRFLKVNEL